MEELGGRVAFVTGGGSGIGLAIARALLAEGVKVAVADVDDSALERAEAVLAGANAEFLAVGLDVTDRAAYARCVDEVESALGPIQVLCNNAGVFRGAALDQVSYEDWDWQLGINLGGVINGVQTLVARMRERGLPGHIVNTASMAGISASGGMGIYNTSKFAVVGMSEALRQDLAPHGIGVSVLCPGLVRTPIRETFLDDMSAQAGASDRREKIAELSEATTVEPEAVAQLVVHGIRANQLYLFPHPEMGLAAAARAEAIMQAFGEMDESRLAAMASFAAGLASRESGAASEN